MELYGTTKTCPKCGGVVFDDTWYQSATVSGKEIIQLIGGDEIIARKCYNCGFLFSEFPLDKYKPFVGELKPVIDG